MRALWNTLGSLSRYPSAIMGLVIIIALIALSLYAPVAIPYDEAVRLWRGGEDTWLENPKNARPRWVNFFSNNNLPETIVLSSQTDPEQKERAVLTPDMTDVTVLFAFDYDYNELPQEIAVFFDATFEEKRPHVTLTWHTPDGREIQLDDFTVQGTETYYVSQDSRLQRRLEEQSALEALFADPSSETPTLLKGRYELRAAGLVFEEDADLDAKLVVYGQVYGWAGTDHKRRDLTVALLWGTPIALAFGFLAAVGSSISTLIIAAIGVWYGHWIDAAIQRITEVNLILPQLAILIMVGTFYSRSIWVMLGVVIALGVFSGGIKSYRALFLQVKESPYIEAAQAYGANHMRIVLRYMIPRVIPLLVPGFVTLIPSFVFLEASLAILGLGDPLLPTWGKLLSDARVNGALFHGYYYWVLEPTILLMITGLGFAMVGFALDRIFNPRLRDL